MIPFVQHQEVNQHKLPLSEVSLLEKTPIPSLPSQNGRFSQTPKAYLYIFIFGSWIGTVLWFHPRLIQLLDMAYDPISWLALRFFIAFVEFAWLYGMYNFGIIIFALIYRFFYKKIDRASLPQISAEHAPPVAILYTTCNDFVLESVESCVQQDYPNYTVYLLDDSSDPIFQAKVDAFAAQYPHLTQVVRRPDRKAFKAGNMNHGLSTAAVIEPYFAIADADEILPTDFLSKLVPYMEADPRCGFVQANHRANPASESKLSRSQGVGIDIHWKWYQPLRNEFGFVMFLGHGALLRRKCWEEIGGFPDIVSEDLGFAIHARENGYRGHFVEDVICYEDFPDNVRAFRIRHMKWTRGTCEFLSKKGKWLLKAKNISWTEKLDIFFPTMNLPLTLFYFLFMLVANLALPALFGVAQPLTFELAGTEFVLPIIGLDKGFNVIFTPDFFIITILTFFAPVLCFILSLLHRPFTLFRFLSHSTALYAALGPLSSIGVISYILSGGKAFFLVTGDNKQTEHHEGKLATKHFFQRIKEAYGELIAKSHPDKKVIQGVEIATGLFFAIMCVLMFQISFMGLCLAFVLLAVMHHIPWENKMIQVLVYVPFLLMLLGVSLGAMSAFGMQTVFFGYGFHF